MSNTWNGIRRLWPDSLLPSGVRNLLAVGFAVGGAYLIVELLYATLLGPGLPLPVTYWILTLVYVGLLVVILALLFHAATVVLRLPVLPVALLVAGGWLCLNIYAVAFMWVLNPYAWIVLSGLLLVMVGRRIPGSGKASGYWFSLALIVLLSGPTLHRAYWSRTAGVDPQGSEPVFSAGILEHLAWTRVTWDPTALGWGAVLTVGSVLLILVGERLFVWLDIASLARRRTTWLLLVTLLVLTGLAWSVRGQSNVPDASPPSTYFAGTLPGEIPSPPQSEGRPNILLISVDTLRWDRVLGPSKLNLPHLASLARDSLVFTNAVSSSSWTRPAHGSLFSGRHPLEHGAVQAHDGRLYPNVWLYPQYLQRMGYRTGAFTDGGNVSQRLGFARGYDRYREPEDPQPHYDGFIPGAVNTVVGLLGPGDTRFNLRRGRDRLRNKSDLYFFRQNLQKARRWLTRGDGQQEPFYLFLHTYQVHDYYHLYPEAFRQLMENRPDLANHVLEGLPNPHPPRTPQSLPWFRAYEALYDEGVRKMDRALGAFLAFLKRRNLYDRTLIVFLSDHGEGFSPEGPVYHGNGQTHESLIRVPLMVKPARPDPSGALMDATVPLIAVFPLLDRLGGPDFPREPGVTEGKLRGLLGDRAGPMLVSGSVSNRPRKGFTPVFFVRLGDHKLRLDTHDGTREYLRVASDTLGEHTVPRTAVPVETRERLDQRMKDMLIKLEESGSPYHRRNGRLEPALRRTLRGLGYMP